MVDHATDIIFPLQEIQQGAQKPTNNTEKGLHETKSPAPQELHGSAVHEEEAATSPLVSLIPYYPTHSRVAVTNTAGQCMERWTVLQLCRTLQCGFLGHVEDSDRQIRQWHM